MKTFLLQQTDYKTSIKPVASLAATLTGETIDRLGFNSAMIRAYVGALTGTPDTVSAVFKVFQGDASNMSDEAEATNVTFTIAAASTGKQIYAHLINAKRYVRIKCVLTFTGGTTPTAAIEAGIVLGDPKKAKVATDNVYDLGNNKLLANGNW